MKEVTEFQDRLLSIKVARQVVADALAKMRRKIETILAELEEGDDWKWYEGYSGRGMFGEEAPLAVSFSSRPPSDVAKKLSKLGMASDSLGMGAIFYFKGPLK